MRRYLYRAYLASMAFLLIVAAVAALSGNTVTHQARPAAFETGTAGGGHP